MQFREFLLWLKQRGLLPEITEIDVWANDDDGCRELTTEQTDGIIGEPVICFYAVDAEQRGQLLVVEAYDPNDVASGIDYRVWVPITIGVPDHKHVRMVCHQPYCGDSGSLAYWMNQYDLQISQLTII